MVERWLNHAALPHVKVALAEKQAIPEQPPGARKRAALCKVFVVGHQNVTDKIRMIQQENILTAELYMRDVPKLASHSFEEGERILPEAQKNAAGKSLFRSGRKASHTSFGRHVLAKPAHHIEGEQRQLRLAPATVNRLGTVSIDWTRTQKKPFWLTPDSGGQ
jgi:hypothetical protein